jgi:hypothetical protein
VSVAFIRKRIDGGMMIKHLHHHLRCRECDRAGTVRGGRQGGARLPQLARPTLKRRPSQLKRTTTPVSAARLRAHVKLCEGGIGGAKQ